MPGRRPRTRLACSCLIDAGFGLAMMAAQYFVGGPPDAIAVAIHLLHGSIGAGLLRTGRRFRIPAALAFLAIKGGVPLVRNGLGFLSGGVDMIVTLVFVLLAILPIMLLLIGRCGPFRRRVALGLFVIAQVLELLVGISRIVVMQIRDGH